MCCWTLTNVNVSLFLSNPPAIKFNLLSPLRDILVCEWSKTQPICCNCRQLSRESFLAQSRQKQIRRNGVNGQTDKFVGFLIARDPFSAKIRFLNSTAAAAASRDAPLSPLSPIESFSAARHHSATRDTHGQGKEGHLTGK